MRSLNHPPPHFAFSNRFEVFFDGACPLCVKEMRVLRWMDRRGRLQFTDIAVPEFDAGAYGLTFDAFMAEMHGRLPDGTMLRGVEVFRQMYGRVGLGPVVAFTRLPGVAWVLELAYRRFARNRLRLTGRCHAGSCDLAPPIPGTAR